MRKLMIGTAMVGLCLAMTACNKPEPAANDMNETVVDANAADAGAVDANAAGANATE